MPAQISTGRFSSWLVGWLTGARLTNIFVEGMLYVMSGGCLGIKNKARPDKPGQAFTGYS
jgi:hypothetical protein